MSGQELSPSIKSLANLKRGDFVSQASFIVGTYQPAAVKRTAQGRVQAAKAFLESLTDEQREDCQLKLTDQERREWTNLPAPPNAGGVRLGILDENQVRLACQLMATLFSNHGYRKVRDIMLADDQLLRNGRARPGFGTENFSVVVFGTPSEDQPWAFQVDGHHVGVNLAMQGDQVELSPSFIGTQPHDFTVGGVKFQPFQYETELAHQLATSLNDDQVRAAVLGPQRGRILTGPGQDGKTPDAQGLKCNRLNADQQQVLMNLISQWVKDLPKPLAKKRMKQLESEIDQMYFSWNGNRKRGSDVSYRIQSPTLVIEYACQSLGGNPIDHLHSMYRNPANDYGQQLK